MVKSITTDLDLVFHSLADSTRRSIVQMLLEQPRLSVSEIAKPFKMSLVAISKHLKVLEKAQLLHRQKQGSFYYMSLNAEALQSAEEWLLQYQRFWNTRLDSLKNFIENTEENKK